MTDISLSEKLITFSLDRARTVSERTTEIVSLSLFDWLTVGLAGVDEPVSQKLLAYAGSAGGSPEASLFGSDHKTTCRMAALVNGTTSHALDYDDTHFAYIGHTGTVIFPTLLALSEKQNATMSNFLEAAAVGYEVACRVGMWLGREHYQVGYHQTATAGAIGATLAAARLIGLNAAETSDALGLVTSRAAGLKSQFGTMGKPMNAGLAAANAVECAELARLGVTSNPDALEGQNGFGQTHYAELNTDIALADLGQVYILEGISHKYHACCHGLHAALEALRGVLSTHPFAPEQLKKITINTHPRWVTVCNIAEPQTGLETKFSYRHTAALLLCGYDTGNLDSYRDDLALDTDMQALRKLINVEGDTSIGEMACEIRIKLTDGTVIHSEYDLAEPLSPEDMRLRLTQKARALVSTDTVDAVWQATRPEGGSVLRMSKILRGLNP